MFTFTLVAVPDVDYKEIFYKLCPIISEFQELRDLNYDIIQEEIHRRVMETILEENNTLMKGSDLTKTLNINNKIQEYKQIRQLLLKNLNKEKPTAVLEAINVCDQFRDKAISEWNEPKGTVTQEEFKKELEKIYEKHKTEIERQRQEYRDIKALLSNEKEKTGQQISNEQNERLKELQRKGEEIKRLSHEFPKEDRITIQLVLEMMEKNEKRKLDAFFLESETVKKELILKLEINKVNKLIERKKSKQRLEELNDEKARLNDEKARLNARLNQISENKKSNFAQKFLSFFSWLFSWPLSFF